MLESGFQSSVIKEIKKRLPGCIILKNDSSYKQGIPDLIILFNEKWATLECKRDKKSKCQPNQEYYVKNMNEMSFSKFIYPQNRKQVLNELDIFFKNGFCGGEHMVWKDFSKTFKDGEHAFLGASQHSWYNYDDEKLVKVFINKLAASRGTALHDLACRLIELKKDLPGDTSTLGLYVNDCIKYGMKPEYKLYYSKFAYGTTDAIQFENHILRISDLKTGKTKVTFLQLKIYAALFFLCYPEIPLRSINNIELRIYQNNDILLEKPEIDEILPIIDKIERYSRILEELEMNYDK